MGISLDIDGWDLLIVSDGMGGHPNGDQASRCAVDVFPAFFLEAKRTEETSKELRASPWDAFTHRVEQAFDKTSRQVAGTGGGATLSVLFRRRHDNRIVVAWVGDSTVCKLQKSASGLELKHQVTEHGFGPYLNKCVGWSTRGDGPVSRPALADWGPMSPGDLFVVMSDGVSGVLCTVATRKRYEKVNRMGLLTDAESFEECLTAVVGRLGGLEALIEEPLGLHAAATAMCEWSVSAGSSDNCTMILAAMAGGT
jgi:serine/threonine protein phosphatase PrpC